MTDLPSIEVPFLRALSPLKALAIIAVASAAVVVFLFWLIYFKPVAGYSSRFIAALPAANASFNALSSIFLISGYVAVKRRGYMAHVKLMLAAIATSTLFFVSYVVYHSFHGDTKFAGTGAIRPIYFFILITHIVLSAAVVPMILTSLYLALAGRMTAHRRVSRWTLPVWLYVSVTGVVIFIMLKVFNAPPLT